MSRVGKIGLFIFCFILGITIVLQTKNAGSEHAFVSAKGITDNEVTIAAEREEINNLHSRINETQQKLDLYNSEVVSEEDILSETEKNYEEAKKIAGFTQVQGEGISIFLDDGIRDLFEWETANDIIVHDLDIMIIINELINAGAEAISINGERFIPSTEISCSGHTVKINGRTHARPFYINAIGDTAMLYAAMTIPGGYGDILTQYGILFNVEKSDAVVIPAYKVNLTINYMLFEKEGE